MFYELNYSKIFLWFRVKCLKQGIKNRNSVLNRVKVRGAGLHLPTQGFIVYPPGVAAGLIYINRILGEH